MDGCKNNPEILSRTKVDKNISSGLSMSAILSIKEIKNKHVSFSDEDCMKKFCECLKKYKTRIINFEEKKMKLLTTESRNHLKKQKPVIVKLNWTCWENFKDKYVCQL